jgi:hypothetical protein
LKHGSKSQPILNEAKIGKVSLKIWFNR